MSGFRNIIGEKNVSSSYLVLLNARRLLSCCGFDVTSVFLDSTELSG